MCQLPVDESQRLLVPPRYHLVAVTDSDPELSHSDHLLLGVVETLVKVSPHHMDVTGQGLQVVQSLLGAQIARAENVLDPAGNEQLLKFSRESGGPVGDVKISEHEHQHYVGKSGEGGEWPLVEGLE